MNTRKIIIILIVILLVAAIGYGVWNLFLREPQGGASGEDSAPMMPQATTATATSGFEETAGDRGEEGEDDILPQPDRKEASESQRPVDDGLSDQESKASSEKLKVLTENEVLGATLTQDEADLKYYRKKDGYVFRTDFEGQKRPPSLM